MPLVGYKEGEAFALAAYRNSTTRLVHGLRLDTALVCGDDDRLPEDRAARWSRITSRARRSRRC